MMDEPAEERCPRHGLALGPDGRCELCLEGVPGDRQLRLMIKALGVLAVIAVLGISYLVCQSSAEEEAVERILAGARRVPITMYMADW